jgi:hypothetical protein
MLAVGALVSAMVMAPVLNLLVDAYGIGVATAAHPNPLNAPQANLMASVARGVFGDGLPWDMIAIGAGVGHPANDPAPSAAWRAPHPALSGCSGGAQDRRRPDDRE